MAVPALSNLDLTIQRGSTFSQNVTGYDDSAAVLCLSGYNLSGFCRYQYSSTGNLLSLNPSGVNSSGISGQISISISATNTSSLPITQFPYDIKIYSGVYQNTILYGKVSVLPNVTY